MGIGYVVIAPEKRADMIIQTARKQGEKVWAIGRISGGKGGVVFCQS